MRSCRRLGPVSTCGPASPVTASASTDATVSLKRYLLDRRVPADLRTDLPLVAEGSRVVWIPGLVSDVQEESGRAFVRLRLERAETRA